MRTRPDGLTFAVLCPEGPARHRLCGTRHEVLGIPLLSRLVLWSFWADESERETRRETLLRALQRPPAVNFGPIEERRAREF